MGIQISTDLLAKKHRSATFNFTSFTIKCQLYQKDGWLIMKGCVYGTHLRLKRCPPQAKLEPGTA